MSRLRSAWRNLVHRSRVDRDLDDELAATFELIVDERIRSGMAPDAARRAARLELGSVAALRDRVADARAGAGLDTTLQDVRYALRLFRRAPGFTALAVATLALGIGANAAIFGVVKSALLDALPYTDADRLIRVSGRFLDGTPGRLALTAAAAHLIATRQHAFERIVAVDSVRDAVYGGDEIPRLVTMTWVEPAFFAALGVAPALGRTFDEDDRAIGYVPASGAEIGPDTARSVVISHTAWRRLFAGDPAVVGRDVRINGLPRTVIGVLPRGFVGPNGTADFYFAFDLRAALASGAGWLAIVGRLKPGVTRDAAQREIDAIWASREHAAQNSTIGLSAIALRDAMVGSTRTPLLVLLASAGLVLLIACANLSGAMLARGLSRRREFAVRAALGAARRRLARQLLTESTILALTGGAAGLVLAEVVVSLVGGLARPMLPAHTDLSLDPGAAVATVVISLVTGLAFGAGPAISIGRLQDQGGLRDGSHGASESRRPRLVRGVLVAVQVALCASLLAGAGVLTRTLRALAEAPLGFEPAHVLTAKFRLSTRDYPTLDARARFHERLADRLRRLPAVDAIAIANKIPTVDPRRASFDVADAAPDAEGRVVLYANVSDEYFRALRIPVRLGRTFDASDRGDSPPTTVVSESLARRYWSAGGAIGSRMRLDGVFVTIVGVVGDVRNDLAQATAEPMAYRSNRQESTQRFCVLVRTEGDPLDLVNALQRDVAALDRSLPVQEPMTLDAALGDGLAARRLPVLLISAFGALALVLASVGIYAMFAGMGAARAHEFGIRIALGSTPWAIAALMLRQGAAWLAAGVCGGAAGIALVVRILHAVVPGAPAFDPIAAGGAVALLAACAAAALLVPIWRAARVDPIAALRAD